MSIEKNIDEQIKNISSEKQKNTDNKRHFYYRKKENKNNTSIDKIENKKSNISLDKNLTENKVKKTNNGPLKNTSKTYDEIKEKHFLGTKSNKKYYHAKEDNNYKNFNDNVKNEKINDKKDNYYSKNKLLKNDSQVLFDNFSVTKNNNKEKIKAKINSKNRKELKVMFLGGVGEIGKNMTVLEYDKDIIVIDAGITFPGANMPGVDLVMPDITYLIQNKNRVRGFVVTHGHEDHIGSFPYILKDLNVPVYATKLTLTLIENKLKETKNINANLNCIKAGNSIKLGVFSIEFINVNHSIADALALSITTPVGVVFHTGDFKIDFTPVKGETTDLTRIAEIGKKGVMLMLCDSTNVEIEGTTMSESLVKKTLEHVFEDNISHRLIIATFASNVHRLQQILDLTHLYRRKVAFSGRSMINIADAAEKIGELTIPNNLIVDIDQVKNYKDDEIVIICTGTQGEPMSALTRMARGEFNKVSIGENDTIVLSSSVIPGNEKMIYGVINNLYRLGAEVIYESLEPIHVSGHACKGELRVMHSLVKPKFFIPVHGEYRHLKKHALLAESMGMNKNNILIADIGDCIIFNGKSMKRGDKIPAGSRFIDGVGIDGADSFILRDRIHLSEDGIVVAVVAINELSAEISSVEIISKGLVLNDSFNDEAKANLSNALNQSDIKKAEDESEISALIRRTLKNYIFRATKKNPMILPIVMVV